MCDTANAQNHRWLAKLHFNVIWLNHTIFSVSLMMDVKFQLIYLINESIRKSCGGWLFWGAFIALPLRPACVVWFVERLKWGWLVEQRLALDLHTLLNHTDSWLPALPTTPPQTQIYLRAGAPLDAEPCGSFNTQPSAESQLQPAIDNSGCCAATATKWFPARTAWEDIGPNFRRRGRIGDRNKKRGSEGSAGQVAIVVGRINLWLKAQRVNAVLQEDYGCISCMWENNYLLKCICSLLLWTFGWLDNAERSVQKTTKQEIFI